MNTKHKKIAVICFLTIMLAMLFAVLFPAAAKNNIALECEIDSFCGEAGESKSARMLVDVDPNYETKWEVSDEITHPGEPHWIILDFGTEKTFDSIKLVKASQGTEDFGKTELDASGFRFEVSSDKKSWVQICEATDDGENDIYDGNFTPVTARYLKLVITQPERDENVNINQAVRLYDLKVYEYIAPVEEDETDENDLEIDDPAVPSANLTAPDNSDSVLIILFLLFAVISAIVISRIFLNRRSRSV